MVTEQLPFSDVIDEAVEVVQPKRRGRKPGSKNKPKGDVPPDDGEESKPSGRGRQAASRKSEIQPLVLLANVPLEIFPATREDSLNDEEVEALVEAFDGYQKVSPRFRKLITRLARGSALGALLITCASIAYPRLVRHGLLPGNLMRRPEPVTDSYDSVPTPPPPPGYSGLTPVEVGGRM